MVKLAYETVKQRLLAIPKTRDRVLLVLIYVTGGRVGEIVWHKKYEQKPVQKKDIKSFLTHLTIFVYTEKIKVYRKVLLSRQVESHYIDLIEAYIEGFKNNQYLFPMTTRNAQKIFRKYFPEINVTRKEKVLGQKKQGIHLMRKWRATHMKQNQTVLPGEICDDKFIMLQLGWKDRGSLDKVYDQTGLEDYKYLVIKKENQ